MTAPKATPYTTPTPGTQASTRLIWGTVAALGALIGWAVSDWGNGSIGAILGGMLVFFAVIGVMMSVFLGELGGFLRQFTGN